MRSRVKASRRTTTSASVGPYFEVVASEAYNKHEQMSLVDYAKKTGELWFDKNFHHEREGNMYDPMMMGFVFGTKGLGVGHIQGIPKLPWLDLANRNFSDLKRGYATMRGQGKMTGNKTIDACSARRCCAS